MLPELLSPAGNLEKLKIAINYGADAVYLGLQKFGLRSAAENFNLSELNEGVQYAHQRNAKVFVVLNAYLHDKELEELPAYLKEMEAAGVDAVIVSDLGVVKCVLNHSSIPVHLSTQASCLNYRSAKLWKDMGAERIVLGREISLEQAAKIKEKVDIELEMFIHGSMCMAYSGNCVISNYTQGRDSNRGGCAHSCRFEYSLEIPTENGIEKTNSFFMSSKDLNGIMQIQKFIDCGIDSLKIEGRMRNHLYLSSITGAYRKALDAIARGENLSQDALKEIFNEMTKLAHREYTEASLLQSAGKDSVYRDREKAINTHKVVGKILEVKDNEIIFLSKSNYEIGQKLEPVNYSLMGKNILTKSLEELDGELATKCKPNRIYRLNTEQISGLRAGDILRTPV